MVGCLRALLARIIVALGRDDFSGCGHDERKYFHMGNQRSPAATEPNDNNRRAGLDEISAASGEQLTSSTPATAMTNVLSFDKGAWDDRELINAYDASLLEFHVS